MGETTKSAFERVQTARHPNRPYTLDIIKAIFEDFVEIHGDRRFADDPAIVCGFATFEGTQIAIIGQQKGRDINERRHRNFAMTKPEGYRKALRLMNLAEKFERPVVCFVDTPGAYPGIDAEERGQAEAIAFNLRAMASLRVPIIVVVIGEGGSGGALAIGVGDRILMMENAVYSVITPEGCAAILWKDASQAPRAAECLRLTALDLKEFGLVDEVVSESVDWLVEVEDADLVDFKESVWAKLGDALRKHLSELSKIPERERRQLRYEKFRRMGRYELLN